MDFLLNNKVVEELEYKLIINAFVKIHGIISEVQQTRNIRNNIDLKNIPNEHSPIMIKYYHIIYCNDNHKF